MSQETVVSQTTPVDPQGLVDIRLPTTPPSGDEALSHAEDGGDVELCAVKPTSDLEAGVIASPLASSGEGDVENAPEDGSSSPRMRKLDVSMLVITMTWGLPAALFSSVTAWGFGLGVAILIALPPYNSLDPLTTLKASIAGAPVVALAIAAIAFVDLVFRRLGKVQSTPGVLTVIISAMCVFSSTFGMSLGFMMMPYLMTEMFGAVDALVMSTMGLLGGFLGIYLCYLFIGSLIWLWRYTMRMCAPTISCLKSPSYRRQPWRTPLYTPPSVLQTEAGAVAIVSPFPSPEVHDIGSSPQDGPHLPRMRISGLLKMFVILTTCGLPAALYFSAIVWYVGGTVLKSLIAVLPYNSMDSVATFKAPIAGAPIIALTVGAVVSLDFALRRLPGSSSRTDSRRTKYNILISELLNIWAICAPSSAFAVPLGFVMVPGLATEAFGAWHAHALALFRGMMQDGR
ncbi:hypothetical protein LXA43DRAFT_1068164 [Ganoderma leucocontextum]|nr:hypothetical protein LXA43DRAFT_1068164 [Ganoderma leucocontextum]